MRGIPGPITTLTRPTMSAGGQAGLRNADGTGVLAGVTQIGNVLGYYVRDGERYPMDGKLIYRGINVEELIGGFMQEGRFGFEETAYLLLFRGAA